MIQISLSRLPSQEFRVVLEGQLCTVWLYQRGRRLFMDLTVGDVPVFRGASCIEGGPVNRSPSPAFSGTFHFHDFEGREAPGWEGLESRWVLCWVPEGEAPPERFMH
jgi:hypothetical protein